MDFFKISALVIFCLSLANAATARIPVWTFTPSPESQTTQTVPVNSIAFVQYKVQNQSQSPIQKHLLILPTKGISQLLPCNLDPKGSPSSSCLLSLQITGSELPAEGINDGPFLCQTNSDGSLNREECYQPSLPNVLHITPAPLPPSATLTSSVSDLALSVTGLTNGPLGPAVSSGKSRIITIQNTSISTAQGLQVNATGLPVGTNLSNGCGSTLAPGASCNISIQPGSIATSDDSNLPCNMTAPGTSPVPGTITVTAANANQVSVNVLVLGYGCVYQSGFIFDVDDSTADTGSIGGKIVFTVNQGGGNKFQWSTSAGQGTAANSTIDGARNTDLLASATFPAAFQCYNFTGGGFINWYLPAVCEMTYDTCGGEASPTLQNLYSTLGKGLNRGDFSGLYWSSTSLGENIASAVDLQTTGTSSPNSKVGISLVRCVRTF